MNRFGKALKELRQQFHLRQDDLARMVGVERSTVANWERGAKQPSLDMLIKLSEIFGVSLDQLVGVSRATVSIPAGPCFSLASDPVVRLLAERTGVPAKTIAAFIAALKMPNGNCGSRRKQHGHSHRHELGLVAAFQHRTLRSPSTDNVLASSHRFKFGTRDIPHWEEDSLPQHPTRSDQ